jgi:glycine/D-amino acid oxidase-like deaminating enzyme
MRLRIGVPLWLSGRNTPRRRYPMLRGRVTADVAIVGGGITGAGIAQAFAEAGVKAVLLESKLVGRGSTAASTALVMHETDEGYTDLERRYGHAGAERLWTLSRSSVRDLVATVRRLGIDCDLTECDAIHFTTSHERVADLYSEYQRRRSGGFAATWLEPAALRAETSIDGAGAIRTRRNAQLDPYRACVGLMRAAAQRGAHICERSTVQRIDSSRSEVVLHTRAGTVTADRVIVATGYATPAFAPLAGRFRMNHTYVLATRRLRAHERRMLGLGDFLLWDTERPYHYARWTPDGRLLLGGNDRALLPPSRRRRGFASSRAQLRDYYGSLLPALKDVEIEFAWEGLFARTRDGLPYIGVHRRYPRHLFALGYGGNGMTFGFLAARLLVDAFLNGGNQDDLKLFKFGRLR